MSTKLKILFILFLITSFSTKSYAEIITFSAVEREPYIGKNLPNQGYVGELLTKVFSKAGYEVKIKYYPLLRAIKMAEMGKTDGLAPLIVSEMRSSTFDVSESFPGNQIGMLKQKNFSASYKTNPRKNIEEALKGLGHHRFGVVRGDFTLDGLNANNVKKDLARTHLQNLDKLNAGRIKYALIDKFTAADMMVKHRPQYIGKLEFMTPPLSINDFHIGFPKENTKSKMLLKIFNDGLKQFVSNGELDRILSNHGLLVTDKGTSGKKRITIGTVSNGDMKVMQELSKEFERINQDIEIEWRVLGEDILRQRLMGDLAISDGQFDVMTIGAYEAPIWAKRKWILPLKNLPNDYEVDDLLKPMRDSLSFNGQLYALPFYGESTMLFYRKDLFKKAGLKMPQIPKYSEIKNFASKIHNPGDQTYGICLRGAPGWGANMAFINILVNTFGGGWFDKNWTPLLNSPEWHDAINFYVDLVKKYGPPRITDNNFQENLDLFREGHCGMWIDATVAAGMLFDSTKSKIANDLGFAPTPIASSSKGSHWLWTWSLAIPSSSKMSKEALKFVTWATSKKYIELVAKRRGWLSVPPGTRESTYKNPKYLGVAPFADFVLQSIKNADPNDSSEISVPYTGIQFVGIPEYPALGIKVGELIASAVRGEITVDDALEKAQKFVQEQMTKSGYLK